MSSSDAKVDASAGNAGMRPATDTLAIASGGRLERPLQADGTKSAPHVPGAGFAPGRGAGGGGAYVHTDRNIARETYEGTTEEGIESERNRLRYKDIAAISWALQQSEDDREKQAGLRLLGCGRWFQRINFACGTYRLIPYPCDSIFCPECSARRSKTLIERICKRLDQTLHDYWFLTITVKNISALDRSALDKLIRQFGELRSSDEWRGQVTGGVYSIEATYNSGGSWHPHFHVLIETGKSLPFQWIFSLRSRWREITSGSHVINLERVFGQDKKGRKTRKVNHRALRELVKYATKAHDFSGLPKRILEFHRAFASVRRVQSFGSFLGCTKEVEEEKEEGNQELVGCACGACRWKDGTPAGLFHITETEVKPDGFRQLRLFHDDIFGKSPPSELAAIPLEYPGQLDLFFTQTELPL